METVNAVMKQVVPILMIPVNRNLRYLISYPQYVREMAIKLTELNAVKVGVEEHKAWNTSSHLEVPAQVTTWLQDVEKINAKVENIPNDIGGFNNLKTRHKAGRKAFKIIEEIDSVMRQHDMIMWTDRPVPLARVDSTNASTSTTLIKHNDFESREAIFTEALKALGPNNKAHMVALCGMGGVGKTTMMQRLQKVAKEKRMFGYVIEVAIGEKTDPIAIQEDVANYLSVELKETSKGARAERLRRWFEGNSDGGKTKFLIVLDDVWQFVDLNDIGLSPLPDQSIDFKVLLTSRDRHVCSEMGVESNLILDVKVLTDVEGKRLFRQFVKGSNEVELDNVLETIADDIASRCQGLPIIIRTMSSTLKGRSRHVWEDALSRLEHYKIRKEIVREVFKISYDNLQDEEIESVFLLCALYPEDFNIPTEELVRYGWGLELFKDVDSIREARNRVHTCIERLTETNLLIESNDVGYVKMHDMVRAFVMHMFSEVEHASIVNHGSKSRWPENNMSGSYRRISLTCKGMSEFEFPKDLKFPNLSILKLMHGDKTFKFPQGFYEEMEKLQVISYHEMKYSLLPSSPHCSTNLRVLHLHRCSLMFDCSSIGNMLNLEVLSFANSKIEWLPSTIGNLKKLRLLDLTDCNDLRIDNGVLKKLVKLEELYMRVRKFGKAIRMTNENCNEMVERSGNLSTLEFEFYENIAQPKNMSFQNLQRFKISVGSYLSKYGHSSENMLQLTTSKIELLESRLNELFEKTEVLLLRVGDMNGLSDFHVKHSCPLKSSSFYNLRVLSIFECAELRYLFTLSVANTLSRLEELEVYKCDNMEELIHTEGSGKETITFLKLKVLSLGDLPKLSSLCQNVNIIKFPQLTQLNLDRMPSFTSIYPDNKLETVCLMKQKFVMPKLEELYIDVLENLKEIWPCEFNKCEEIKLRKIEVKRCDNLVNLFPRNPISLVHHLEELEVYKCRSIEGLFNMDSDFVGKVGESKSSLRIIKVNDCNNLVNLFPCNPMSLFIHLEELEVTDCRSIEVVFEIDLDCVGEFGECSNLRRILLDHLWKLREVWRIKGAHNSHVIMPSFRAVESISVRWCKRFKNIYTPTSINFDLGPLVETWVSNSGRGVDRPEYY